MGKKVLGLDLGVGSIGWCLITLDKDEKPQSILGMGSRIVPLSTDDATEFTKGEAISKNKMRTMTRTIRKGMDRYQLRREALKKVLREHGMLPDEALIKLPLLELWELRARAATPGEQLSLTELGRVLLHINQKRGYNHAKADEAAEADIIRKTNRSATSKRSVPPHTPLRRNEALHFLGTYKGRSATIRTPFFHQSNRVGSSSLT